MYNYSFMEIIELHSTGRNTRLIFFYDTYLFDELFKNTRTRKFTLHVIVHIKNNIITYNSLAFTHQSF